MQNGLQRMFCSSYVGEMKYVSLRPSTCCIMHNEVLLYLYFNTLNEVPVFWYSNNYFFVCV